jgi:photosystem II stability/assembly factor-like uncharacterized protein
MVTRYPNQCLFLSALLFVLAFLLAMDHRVPASASDAMQALELWTQSRAYPFADISPDAHYRAFQYVRSEMSEARSSVVDAWRSIGPINFSGRMIAVALNPHNPSTIYAGAASGGLWRSFTGGLGGDWHRVETGFPVLGVNAIAIDPTDTNVIYIGTGEVYRYQGSTGGIVIRTTRGSYGMGILKTTNGGRTWTKSLDWSYHQQRGVQALRLNPLNPHTIFAATSEGIFKSKDAGITWSQKLNALLAQDIVINAWDTMQVLATCGNFGSMGRGVYRSTDGGESFTMIGGLPAFSGKGMLAQQTSNPLYVLASLADSTTGAGTLWRSTDFGASWNLLSSEALYGVQGWYSQFVAVHPTDANQVVRGGVYIFKSTNGGVTSVQKSGAYYDMHNFAHHPSNPNILYVVSDGGVFRSTNFGDTYEDANAGLLTSQFYNGFSNSAQDSFMAMGQVQDHFGYRYVGTLSWPSGAVDEIGWTAINQQNDLVQYAGNRGGASLYKSTNRGTSFFSLSGGFTGTSCWNTPFVLSSSNPNVLYFGRSIVYKTTNAGSSWSPTNGGVALDGNPLLSMAVAPTHHDTVYVGTVPGIVRPHVYRTTNGGSSWTDVTGILPNRYYMDIAVDPRDACIVYVAVGGFDTIRVARSVDAGASWMDISGTLPNVPATAVAVDPFNPNHVYVGTDVGVFVSTNGGGDWMSFNEGFPEAVIVADLVVSPSNRSLRAATHSNGVYERRLLSTPTSVEHEDRQPMIFALEQNYPNPFNPTTTIRFSVESASGTTGEPGRVTLKVYDVLGREVATLVNEHLQQGSYEVTFSADGLPSGVYLYRLKAGEFTQTRRMLLLR